jgi:type II secretory pathway predicted ATPase ExeA
MSIKFYGFIHTPFTNEVRAKDIFPSSQISELHDRLNYYLTHKGIGLVLGEIGSGKTTAVRSWVESQNPNNHKSIYLPQLPDKSRALWRTLARSLDLTPDYQKDDCKAKVASYIEELAQNQKVKPILIIDEAQNIPDPILEEIRVLTNSQMDSRSDLTIILIAHPSFKSRLKGPDLKALAQRIRRPFFVAGLCSDELKAYINHQLKLAGKTDPLFGDDAISLIFNYSKGIPRIINNLCLDALDEAAKQKRDIIEEKIIEKLINEWENL